MLPNIQQMLTKTGEFMSVPWFQVIKRIYDDVQDLKAGVYDVKIAQAEREILSTYGDTVSVEQKAKSLLKFGKNTSLASGVSETVWETASIHGVANETYVTTNAIDTISSSNAGDTQDVYIEGHTVSGTGANAQFTFVSQTATLNGQSKVTLATPLARVSRAYDASATAFAGSIQIYEDTTVSGGVPTDTSKIHLTIDGAGGETQSFKAATTFSNSDYAIVTGGYAAINRKTSASVDFTLEVRPVGGVFRPAGGRIALNSSGQSVMQVLFDPYVIVPKNADMRVVATSDTNNVEVDASFQAYLASVI